MASAFLNPDLVDGEPVAFEPGLPHHAVATLSLGWERVEQKDLTQSQQSQQSEER